MTTISPDKAKVLKACPKAGCYFMRGVSWANPPYDKDNWRIYRDYSDVSEMIGIGATEAEAWANAAKSLGA